MLIPTPTKPETVAMLYQKYPLVVEVGFIIKNSRMPNVLDGAICLRGKPNDSQDHTDCNRNHHDKTRSREFLLDILLPW
jgi:hypothetical protein